MSHSKNIAIFFDGTWNRADQQTKDGKPCPTNVAKLFEATCDEDYEGDPQLVHYVRGVGTSRWDRLRGGGFGYGISDNIKSGYQFLVSNYSPGDHIYLFGFSRGAFAARSLAGLVRNIGILKRNQLSRINEGYRIYRKRSDTWLPRSFESIKFRVNYSWDESPIRFLGVFDTVGALGAPYGLVLGWVVEKLFKCRFHDANLSKIVQSAYHAVAIDEKRLPFKPTLMKNKSNRDESNFEEKWFPGAHSDVGGGVPDTGLSDITLQWMAEKANQHGLKVELHHIDAVDFKPNLMQSPMKSQNLMYRAMGQLLVKTPSKLGIVSRHYKDVVDDLRWNGDLRRSIDPSDPIRDYVGRPPKISDIDSYRGCVHPETIRKINELDERYRPPSIFDRRPSSND